MADSTPNFLYIIAIFPIKVRPARHLPEMTNAAIVIKLEGQSQWSDMPLDVVSQFSGQEMTIFEDIDSAKDWLVEE